jgi:hypothetical protein
MSNAQSSLKPSRAVTLFGTDEQVVGPRLLKAGDLSVELDGGNLRHIRFGGVEIIRAISFIVRDRNWGTYNPTISSLRAEALVNEFAIAYEALAQDDNQAFRYNARIAGFSDGRVVFEANGVAETDFLTNRTGFVVLHPISDVSGRPVTVEQADGRVVQGHFPDLIDPVQPMMNLRALTHEAAPGLRVACRMEGDVFEMEDQRNWADASYKTYVRPLALPWPYTLKKGDSVEQAVRLSVSGAKPAVIRSKETVTLILKELTGPSPRLGVGLDPNDSGATLRNLDTLQALRAQIGVCHYDPQRGHNEGTLKAQIEIAKALKLEPWLEAVVVSIDGFEQEMLELGRTVEHLGRPFTLALLSPAPDLKCTLPGSPWPPAPPPEAFFRAARKAFPEIKIGGGMFSLFTEMNRKRPPTTLLDLVSFTTTATMHAGDDHSVMEGLEALDAIAKSAKAIAGSVPFAVGPSAIGMRMNPYGEAPMANPQNVRQAMNFNDPRQRGLLGAAWTVGFFARFARGGARYISLGGLTGPFGVLQTPQAWRQPWFDEHGGLFPIFHIIRGLAGLAGRMMTSVEISAPDQVAAIAVRDGSGVEVWVANLTPSPQRIATDTAASAAAVLSSVNFVDASRDPRVMERLSRKQTDQRIELPPYAVGRLILT